MEILGKSAIAVEGTPEQIADQLINGFISPAWAKYKEIDQQLADFFGFCVAGKAIAAHLNSVETCTIEESADCLIKNINEMVKMIKADKLLKNPATAKKS